MYYETFSRYFSPICVVKILFLRYEQYRVDNLLKKKLILKNKILMFYMFLCTTRETRIGLNNAYFGGKNSYKKKKTVIKNIKIYRRNE